MAEKQSKNFRTLDVYVRLCEGKIINKSEEAERFGVDERSIQRDIDDIRAFISERSTAGKDTREIIYDRNKKGFVMIGEESSLMSNGEVLAVSKILLESRAFTKKEIGFILDKVISGCVPQKNTKLISELISNEKYHYVELHHKSIIEDKLWAFGENIKQCELMEIIYEKQVASKETVKRIVEPVAVLFSEYYFYLNAFIVELDENGKYVHKFEHPAICRIDRIKKYKKIGIKFKIPYANRFEEGEFRKKVQFMYAGSLQRCRFRYTGRNKEAVFDRLPTALLLSEDESGAVFEVEVYGRGIMMWLLSQGVNVEVLGPESFREKMKKEIEEMFDKYRN